MRNRLLDQRWPWLLAAAGIVLAYLSTYVEIHPPGDWDRRPLGSVADIEALRDRDDVNVLFVLIDTLRADRLGSYGYERDTSPRLDMLGDSGIRFGRHLAQSSWTKTSMASLWSGLHPPRTGITRFDQVLPPEVHMAAEVLQGAGFQTVGLYRNGWTAPTFGFDQGFDVYERPIPNSIPAGVRRENPTLTDRATDESTIEAAVEFLRLRGGERWFLYLHMMDLHEYLYDEESALFGSTYSDTYDNSIRWTDGVVGLLIDHLSALDLLDRTLIVVAADHGEAFSERGFEGHARKVYRETTEVPLLVALPFRLEPGIVVGSRTSNIDLWPTILDLLGLDLPEADGRSRVPEILAAARGESGEESNEPAFSFLDQTWARPEEAPQITVSVSEGPLRYVRINQTGPMVEQLFDASGDSQETRDWAREDPETLERLRAVADAHLEIQPAWETPTRELSELELNHLRALGYVLP
jgi:arylsulfatase A-like enzyme